MELDELNVGFIGAGKLYSDIYEYVNNTDSDDFNKYENKQNIWEYIEFGNTRRSWSGKFYRVIFSRQFCESNEEENGQLVFPFARKESILYTNLGVNHKVTDLLRNNHSEYLKANKILECYHQRGSDELIHRALKEFGTETLPFKRFESNGGYYLIMLISFFLYELFKKDITKDILPSVSYATTFRRNLLDIAGKVIRTGGKVILKIAKNMYNKLKIPVIWELAKHPPFILSY